jgi:NADH dehydrogenase
MIEPSEQLVTVFGGGGFIGRYVCEALFKAGLRVRIAQRDPRKAYIIQPLAPIGRFGFAKVDIANAVSVAEAVKDASAVINLCGAFGRTMRSVHVEGARNIAEAARASGAAALVHVSAIGADRASPSNYGRTKAEGEAAVRKAFPAATIVRPSLVFGPEDNLTNRFARMAQLPVLPVIAGNRKFQPVYVRDLARAIALAALEPKRFAGQAYEIGGPQAMTMTELQQVIHGITGQDPLIVQLPDAAASILSWLGVVPGAPLTRDQWMMLQRDNLPAGGAPGLEAFGIAPTPLAAVGEEWLGRFRRGGKFGARRNNLTATS